mmetsp:Transcript_29883/g.54164  ORF Transcript_29883/g.54164 Transcript_29883/m.54164 type:complete len:433 (-) Transcript_29883:154-1452(-)|eukprot:CAMPEP_0197630674 /NCGR_PEP_ID=MMETSP1338-20131121/8074_1 /TAXON_ID=43686 ORGANISM="Pelagodinium beii, Strain RCC1491" /NCGR_SAMPLE_ID=MMETSP1338 /ASSEMBLY_ACC=CAM_ASM_000754 /LENGTH=432 /DNA_ID=CAMNT_0043201939 /DNA_START=39 /DNA_END=1337 /DNA_ORIENTATION=+
MAPVRPGPVAEGTSLSNMRPARLEKQMRRRQQLAKNGMKILQSQQAQEVPAEAPAQEGCSPAAVLSTAPPPGQRNRRASCPEMLATTAPQAAASMPQPALTSRGGYGGSGQGGQTNLMSAVFALGRHAEIGMLTGSMASLAECIMCDMSLGAPDQNIHVQMGQFMAQYAQMAQVVQQLMQCSPEMAGIDSHAAIALNLMMMQAMRAPKQPLLPAASMHLAHPGGARPTLIASPMRPMQMPPQAMLVPMGFPGAGCPALCLAPQGLSMPAPAVPEGAGAMLSTSPRKRTESASSESCDASFRQEANVALVPETSDDEMVLPCVWKRQKPAETEGTPESAPEPESSECRQAKLGAGTAALAQEDSNAWVVEPSLGGYWDWPLSRPEKKDRAVMLHQMELLCEVEELRAIVDEYEGCEDSESEDDKEKAEDNAST